MLLRVPALLLGPIPQPLSSIRQLRTFKAVVRAATESAKVAMAASLEPDGAVRPAWCRLHVAFVSPGQPPSSELPGACAHAIPAADLARLLARELLETDFGPVECDKAGHYASLALMRLTGCGGAAHPLAGAHTALLAATELCTAASEAGCPRRGAHLADWQCLWAFCCWQACGTLDADPACLLLWWLSYRFGAGQSYRFGGDGGLSGLPNHGCSPSYAGWQCRPGATMQPSVRQQQQQQQQQHKEQQWQQEQLATASAGCANKRRKSVANLGS